MDSSHLVERQLGLWKFQTASPQTGGKLLVQGPPPVTFGPYITISRDYGAGGRQLAGALSARLGWAVFDHFLMDTVAEQAHVRQSVIDSLDERGQNWMRDYLSGLPFANSLTSDEFLTKLIRVATTLAQRGRAILIGRGLNCVLPPEAGVRVRLTAPFAFRVRWLMGVEHLGEAEATEQVAKVDREREQYVRQYFKRDIRDSASYDRVFDASALPMTEVAAQVCRLLEAKLGPAAVASVKHSP
ncbi:MAG: cytidylate kinase-like family protein [Candidatus Riflebacteria bacterium]|nr:cytidylate kinase-like family protein [Candidatus Riflebacteria bacterium]